MENNASGHMKQDGYQPKFNYIYNGLNLAPIALFVYNRPLHTRQTLETLQKNELAAESELFIFSDGPKNESALEKVMEVREYIKTISWFKRVTIIEREKNYGLADSILSGVTEIVDKYGRIIVLEDDMVTSPYFIQYMNDALDIYENEDKVMHIAAYLYPLNEELPETFFYPNTTCWGWATWKRAWDKFEPDAGKLVLQIKKGKLQYDFNINGSTNAYEMLLNQAKGRLDSWAIRWYASVFLEGGLCLHPGKSLVNNIGHDFSGIHCGSTKVFNGEVRATRVSNFNMNIKEDKNVIDKIASFNRRAQRSFIYRGIKDKAIMIYDYFRDKLKACR